MWSRTSCGAGHHVERKRKSMVVINQSFQTGGLGVFQSSGKCRVRGERHEWKEISRNQYVNI